MEDVSPAVSQIINAVGIKNTQIAEFVSNKLAEFQNISQSTIEHIVDEIKKLRVSEPEIEEKETDDRSTFQRRPKSITKVMKNKRSCYIIDSDEIPPIKHSPYAIFVKYMHAFLISIDKSLSFSQRAVLISNLWALMSEKDREPFQYAANKTKLT